MADSAEWAQPGRQASPLPLLQGGPAGAGLPGPGAEALALCRAALYYPGSDRSLSLTCHQLFLFPAAAAAGASERLGYRRYVVRALAGGGGGGGGGAGEIAVQ